MRLTNGMAGALTLALACAAFSGAALAGNGNGDEARGKSAGAPGQQGKAEERSVSSRTPATPPGQAKKAESRPSAASKGKSASAPGRAKAKAKPAAAGGPRTSGRPASPGRSAEAQDNVLVCHRTGSATNPYVIVNISKRGWDNGHSKHEGDVLLRDADVGPGDKPADFGLSEASCPAPAALTTTTTTTEETVFVAGVTSPTTTASAAGAEVAQAAQQPSAGGVAGVQTRIGAPAPAAGRGGVLGALAQVGEAELPFTGLPLWIAALAGLGLAGAGYGVRRATR